MDIYEKMKELGVELPAAPAKGGLYSSCKKFGGNLFYVSGCGPVIDGPVTGRLGKEVTVEQGQVYARACMLNVLAALEKAVGDLRRVKSAVKITTFVQSADDFHEQPAVANGGTQLLLELWGEEAGLPSRSAIGENALPGNIPVDRFCGACSEKNCISCRACLKRAFAKGVQAPLPKALSFLLLSQCVRSHNGHAAGHKMYCPSLERRKGIWRKNIPFAKVSLKMETNLRRNGSHRNGPS